MAWLYQPLAPRVGNLTLAFSHHTEKPGYGEEERTIPDSGWPRIRVPMKGESKIMVLEDWDW